MSQDMTARDKSRATTDDEPTTIDKRARWEAFEFAVPEPGRVRVENHSHADPADHTYDVTIEHGSAVACTCPADEYNDTCKHRVATEANAAVLAAASGVVTDGGAVVEDTSDDTDAADDRDARPEACECAPWMDVLDLPCFECWRRDFETPNPAVLDDSDADGTDDDRDRPRRSEPADFGGGESTGVVDLLGSDDA